MLLGSVSDLRQRQSVAHGMRSTSTHLRLEAELHSRGGQIFSTEGHIEHFVATEGAYITSTV